MWYYLKPYALDLHISNLERRRVFFTEEPEEETLTMKTHSTVKANIEQIKKDEEFEKVKNTCYGISN